MSVRRMMGLGLLALAALALSTCTTDDRDAGPGGAAFVEVRGSALSIADIDLVEVTITGTGIVTPIVKALEGDVATGWSGTLVDIPPGNDRTFTGRAYDVGAELIYEGTASPVVIVDGEMALVTIFMQQVEPPPSFSNAAPRITGLTASGYTVAPGGTLSFTVTADDPDPGDTLAYAWSAVAGSFSSTTTPSTVWTAPGSPGSVLLHIGVSDETGATATADIAVTVSLNAGSSYVIVDINSAPEVTSLVPSPTQLDIGDTTYLDLTATDPDGDTLTYEWDDQWPCEGSFDDPTLEDPSFILAAIQTEWLDCNLRVRVRDGRGGLATATLALATGPGICDGSVCGGAGVPSGELLWDASHPTADDADVADVTYDPDLDHVVVVSSLRVVDIWTMAVDVFSSSGAYLDSLVLSTGDHERAYAADTGADGVGYVAGWYDNAGTELAVVRQLTDGWLTTGWIHGVVGWGAFDVEVGPNGDPYFVAIAGVSMTEPDLLISRVDAEGGPTEGVWNEWVDLAGHPYEGAGLDITTSGNVVVCASFAGATSYDLLLAAFDLDLDPLWSTTWSASGQPNRDEMCEDLAVDGFGNIFVAGHVSDGSDDDWWVAKFDSSGAFINEVTLDEGGDETARSLVIASNGTVYVAGEGTDGGLHPLLLAYRNTLLSLWSSYPLGLNGGGVTLHSDGSVLFAGSWGAPSRDAWVGAFEP